MKTKLYRIILPVDDINKASRFYAKALKQEGIRVSPGRHYFDLDGTILACYDPVADGDEKGSWKFHENQYIYMAVSDLEEMRKEVTKLGGLNVGAIEEMPWGERLFYANDPLGNPICFVDQKTIFTGN